MEDELAVMSAPKPKRRRLFEDRDGQLIEPPRRAAKPYFALKVLASDCLANIVSWLDDCTALHNLRHTGDTVFTNKLNQCVTSLNLHPIYNEDVGPHALHRLLKTPFRNLRLLCATGDIMYCGAFPWAELPTTLTELVIKATRYYTNCTSHNHASEVVSVSLPNLKRLRLDICPLINYPIRLEDSRALTRLSLYPSNSDSYAISENLLSRVPQLTHLNLRHSDKEEDNVSSWDHVVSLDALTNLTTLTLVNCLVTRIPPSIEVLKVWHPDEQVFVAMLTSNEAAFEHLRHLHVQIGEYTDSLWPADLAKVGAPNLHTLHIEHPGDQIIRMNLWSMFPLLRRLNTAACQCPTFWSDIPKDAVLTANNHHTPDYSWSCGTWLKELNQLSLKGELTQAILNMPSFYSIDICSSTPDDVICNAICEVIPVHVLNHVNHIAIRSCPAASRTIEHAISTITIQADFCTHYIDFSNCLRLESLVLNLAQMPETIQFTKSSLATVPSTLKSLACLPAIVSSNTVKWIHKDDALTLRMESNAMPCLPMALIARLNHLKDLDCTFALYGEFVDLPITLETLCLGFNYICSDTLDELEWLKTHRRTLDCMIITGTPIDNETTALLQDLYQTEDDEVNKYGWQRKKRLASSSY